MNQSIFVPPWERNDFWPRLWLLFSSFVFTPKKRGKKKRRINSKNRYQKLPFLLDPLGVEKLFEIFKIITFWNFFIFLGELTADQESHKNIHKLHKKRKRTGVRRKKSEKIRFHPVHVDNRTIVAVTFTKADK